MATDNDPVPFADYLQDLNTDHQNPTATVNRLLEQEKQGNVLLNEFKELYGPDNIFKDSLLDLPLLLKDLRDMFRDKVVIIQSRSSGRFVETLCQTLFNDEDRNAGMQCIKEYRRRGRSFTPSTSESTNSISSSNGNNEGSSKTAHNIAMRFKDSSSKFAGCIEENWKHFLNEYMNACEDYGVPTDKKVQYLYHVLRDDARLFYDSKIRNIVHNFNEACSLMNTEHKSVARQNRIRTQLSRLRVSNHITTGVTASDALECVHRKITKLYLLGPIAYRTEAHKIDYLRSAVICMSWAKE